MPLYEFVCRDCGKEFEKTLRFSEADQRPACPDCHSPDTRKKISKVASFGGSTGSSLGSSSSSSCGSSGGFS